MAKVRRREAVTDRMVFQGNRGWKTTEGTAGEAGLGDGPASGRRGTTGAIRTLDQLLQQPGVHVVHETPGLGPVLDQGVGTDRGDVLS